MKRGGDTATKRWVNGQTSGKSVAIVLSGSRTAGRKWIKYEIEKAWKEGKGLLGIDVHKLTDKDGKQSVKGRSPFDGFTLNGKRLSAIVKTYDPPRMTSSAVYNYIKDNREGWIETAIDIRNNND